LREQKAAWTERAALKKQLQSIDAKDVRYLLQLNGVELIQGGIFKLMGETEDRRLAAVERRRVLSTLLERIRVGA
jgi:hypothetical protein